MPDPRPFRPGRRTTKRVEAGRLAEVTERLELRGHGVGSSDDRAEVAVLDSRQVASPHTSGGRSRRRPQLIAAGAPKSPSTRSSATLTPRDYPHPETCRPLPDGVAVARRSLGSAASVGRPRCARFDNPTGSTDERL